MATTTQTYRGLTDMIETRFDDGSHVVHMRFQDLTTGRWINEYKGAEFEGDRERRIPAKAHHHAVAVGYYTR